MKNLALLLVGVLATLFVMPTLAVNATNTSQKNNDQILIYSAPHSGKILKRLPGNVALVAIYRQKDWIKVGDPRNGQVGWVNSKQMHQAREAFFRPDIQTIYIHTDRNHNGKPELNVVAYKNGKKLSPEQAQQLYEKMRKSQLREINHVRRMTQWIDDSFFRMEQSMFQPIVILPALPQQTSRQESQPIKKPSSKQG